ncbi:hypothetical protein MKW98_007735 [Papaver atlanticum]|uniref:Receptor-like serine/threonine-protein kinase n=1 Tax=Papaver atlanticum TaxID=357466 RepID=A0AAD4S7X4_9MAGN|nr:hypothetical protein MKW98_007735 [Papaver atlanticum]
MSTSLTHFLHFPFLVLILLPTISVAQNVTLGSSLTSGGAANTSWLSPSGDFGFGFRPIEDNNRFLLAIWFDKIPDKTVVWFADGDLQIPKGSKVELTTPDGKLILTDPQGKVLWTAGEQVTGATYAAMLDNGNFVLASVQNSSDYLWESFMNPTDTILPTQFMNINRIDFKLSSRVNDTTYSKGKFRLRMHENGYFALYPVGFPSLTENDYEAYVNKTWSPGRNGSRFVFRESGEIYIVSGNGNIENLTWYPTYISPVSGQYYRATLDFDGVFRQYSHPKTFSNSTQSWTIERSIPENICLQLNGRLGSGVCGYNSYCNIKGDRKPTCQCPPGYEFVDPNNRYGGCRSSFPLQRCQEEDTSNPDNLFEFKTLENVEWPLSDYDKLDSYNETECRRSCMNDCNCAVAVLLDGTCWKKKLPLPNGRLDTDIKRITLIKIRKNGTTKEDPGPAKEDLHPTKDRSTLVLILSLLLGSSVFFSFIFLAAIFLVFFFMNKKLSKRKQTPSVMRSSLHSFTYQELEEATDGFKEELGRGAFGIVYKGFMEEMGSTNSIAVKKLDKVFQEGEKEFKSEVSAIGQTHHRNLVRLLGFCDEGQHRLLVYEFMSNNSLAYHLFGIAKPDWNQRVQIAFGISRGLMYLHEECSNQIIHCDIKPQNILLDDSFTARISDFGLAKLLMNNQTRTLTGIRGTRGYVAPEWFRNAPISAKVDVYSFGVMLLEIICCRKGVELDLGEEDKKIILTDWAYECFKQGKLRDLVDDEDVINDMVTLERLVKIAIWCIQEEPSLRPSMKKVTQMLEGVVEVSVPPCPYQLNTYVENC